jgi:hypothetical protein
LSCSLSSATTPLTSFRSETVRAFAQMVHRGSGSPNSCVQRRGGRRGSNRRNVGREIQSYGLTEGLYARSAGPIESEEEALIRLRGGLPDEDDVV